MWDVSQSRRCLRVVSILLVSIIVGSYGTRAAANNAIITNYGELYPGSSISCSTCHTAGFSTPRRSSNNAVEYAYQLEAEIGSNRSNSAIRAAMRRLEDTFAPRGRRVMLPMQASRVVSTNSNAPTMLPITESSDRSEVVFEFATGLNLNAANSNMVQVSAVPGSGSISNAGGGSGTGAIDFPFGMTLRAIGDRRRSGTPFQYQIAARNAANFRRTANVSGSPVPDNPETFFVAFENIAPIAVDDAFTVPGDVASMRNVFDQGVDRDPDGRLTGGEEVFTAMLTSGPAPGAGGVVLNPDGEFTYTPPSPASTEATTVTFQYQVTDDEGGVSNVATVTLMVEGVVPTNAAPIAQDDRFETPEDTPLMGDVLADNDFGADVDADVAEQPDMDADPIDDAVDSLTTSLVSQSPADGVLGALVLNSDGTFAFTPNADAVGTQTFRYQLSDSRAADVADVVIVVTPVNDAPVAMDDMFSSGGDQTINGNVFTQGVDSDVDGDALTAVVTRAPTLGDVNLDMMDGSFVYVPRMPFVTVDSTDTFDYMVSDGEGGVDTATVTINLNAVAPANQAPVAQDDMFSIQEDMTAVGDVLADNGAGPDTDGDAGPNRTMDADPSDPAFDALTVSLVSQSPPDGSLGRLVLNANGDFTFTPNPNAFGTQRFTYQISDSAAVDAGEVTVVIDPLNDAPVANDDVFSTPGDAELSGNVFEQGQDSDVDGDALSATVTVAPNLGDVDLNAMTGAFVYTPRAPFVSADTNDAFTYMVSDGNGGSDTATVTITLRAVAAANSPPVAAADAFLTDEDVAVAGNVLADNGSGVDRDDDAGPNFDMDANPTRAGFNAIVATIVRQGALGNVALATNGDFTYTPNPNASGVDSFEYQLSDGSAFATATATVTIDPVNDPPVADVVAAPAINESQGPQAFDLLDPNFVSDVDGDALTVSDVTTMINAPALSAPDIMESVVGSEYRFDPATLSDLDEGEMATITVDYQVSDGVSAPVAGRLLITVLGLDNGLGRIAGEYANTIRARYNEHFLTSDQANASCHSCHNVGQVDADIDSVNDCTATVFTPFGLDICLARDSGQEPLADLLRRLQQVEPDYAPQLLSAPAAAIAEDAGIGDPIGEPLTADAGRTVDGTPSNIVGYGIVTGGQLASTDATGQFTVDDSGQLRVNRALTPGSYTLDVRPINDAGQKDDAGAPRVGIPGFFPVERSLLRFVTITVDSARPIAVDDVLNTSVGTTAAVAVLANDIGGSVDAIEIVSQPANGQAALNIDESISYTPLPGFTGADTFTYATTGPGGMSEPATVTVNVVAAGGAVAVADVGTTFINQPITIDVLENDLGDRPIAASLVSNPGSGDAVLNGDGSIDYTPPDGFFGTVVFAYRAENGIGGSEASITIEVSGANGDVLAGGTNDPTLRPVARAIGDSCAAIVDAGGAANADQQDLLNVCNLIAVDVAGNGDIDGALAAIRNEEVLAVADMAAATGRSMRTAIFDRMSRSHGGAGRGLDVAAFNISVGRNSLSSSEIKPITDHLIASAFGDDAEGVLGPFGIFIGGDVTFADRDATGGEDGYDLTSFSMIAGFDYVLNPRVVIGAAMAVSHSSTDFNSGGGIDSDTIQLSVFGSIDDVGLEGFRLSGQVAGGLSGYDSKRAIAFNAGGQAINRTATADFDGHHLNLVGRMEYVVSEGGDDPNGIEIGLENAGTLEISAFADLDYLYAYTESYTETGAGGLSLAVQDQSHESLYGDVGARVGLPFFLRSGTVAPFVEVSANSELLGERPTVTASFAAAGANAGVFRISGEKSDELFGRIRAGATGEIDGTDFNAEYETTVGRDHIHEHSFSFSVGRTFYGGDRLGLTSDFTMQRGANALPGASLNVEYTLRF